MSDFIDLSRCIISPYPQKSVEWLNERKGMITASRRGSIIYLMKRKIDLEKLIKSNKFIESNTIKLIKNEEQLVSLARKIIGIEEDIIPESQMEAVQYGIDNEDKIRDQFSQFIGTEIYELGLCKSTIIPYLGASPDGILPTRELLEIKTTSKPSPEFSYNDFSEITESHLEQMLQNMFVMGSFACHYYSYSRTSDKYYYRLYPFDEERWDKGSKLVDNFYNQYLNISISQYLNKS